MSTHRVFAAVYEVASRRMDEAGFADRRRQLLSEARGRVLEVGAGNGLNLAHYRDVESVTALEPDPAMSRRLLPRLASSHVPIEVVEAGIDDLTEADGAYDTVVCTLVLCTLPDPDDALKRIKRLLAPGGRLLFIEHIAVPGWFGRLQRLASPLWGRLAGGCHLDRDTATTLRAAGFTITDCEKFTQPAALLAAPMMQGIALAPAA